MLLGAGAVPSGSAAAFYVIYVELLTRWGLLNASVLLRFLPANAAQKNMTMFLVPRLRPLVGLPAALRGPLVLPVGWRALVFASATHTH